MLVGYLQQLEKQGPQKDAGFLSWMHADTYKQAADGQNTALDSES